MSKVTGLSIVGKRVYVFTRSDVYVVDFTKLIPTWTKVPKFKGKLKYGNQ